MKKFVEAQEALDEDVRKLQEAQERVHASMAKVRSSALEVEQAKADRKSFLANLAGGPQQPDGNDCILWQNGIEHRCVWL